MGGWNPWRALRERDHLDFRLAPLPHQLGALYWPRGRRAAIVIDPELNQVERRAALAHELVHDERGGGAEATGMPASWQPVVTREEHRVEAEVARRLVPVEELKELARQRSTLELPLTVEEVADAFDVPGAVATHAVQRLSV